MKKIYSLMILGLILVTMLGAVSATTVSTTAIAGKIYTADFKSTVEGATVEVTCNGHLQTVPSLDDGAYSVTYSGLDCNEGDDLSVHAFKSGVGENTIEGEIHDNYPAAGWNLGLVNVPLVPEFGLIAGALTIFGALGMFFVVRRK